MPIANPILPFPMDALEPHVSSQTMKYHFEKHHLGYVKKTNELILGTEYENLSLEDMIFKSHEEQAQKIFNNASQVWNHNFFWQCLSPKAQQPPSTLQKHLATDFGSVDQFKQKFKQEAMDVFGTGWVWLAKDEKNKLSVLGLQDADSPIIQGKSPLLTCDVWEHAYYLDYRNEREKFVDHYFQIVNWSFVDRLLIEDTGHRHSEIHAGSN